jgi:hypothetical protein
MKAQDAAVALKDAGYDVIAVADALHAEYGLAVAPLVAALKIAGFSVTAIAEGVKAAGFSALATAEAL